MPKVIAGIGGTNPPSKNNAVLHVLITSKDLNNDIQSFGSSGVRNYLMESGLLQFLTHTQRRVSAQCEKCQRKLLYMQLALMDGQSHETTICIFVISTLNLVFNILNMMHILHLKHIQRWSSFPVISSLFLQTSEGVTHIDNLFKALSFKRGTIYSNGVL